MSANVNHSADATGTDNIQTGAETETANTAASPSPSPITRQLDKSRQTLLDLSTRNRLLSLPQAATAKLLHFADELTPEVYRLLVSEAKAMSFVPSKTDEEPQASAAEPATATIALPQPDEQATEEARDERGIAQRHRD
ncbi:MAG: DUF4011 domain-containing protein, partial [Comamonas sp.]